MKIVVFVNAVKQFDGADFPSTCSDALKITYSCLRNVPWRNFDYSYVFL